MLARSTACRHGLGRTSRERGVDEDQATVADEQVGRLDVAVGQPDLPHPADDGQPLVDDRVVHLGLADLGGAGDEVGHQQVLPLGGDLHDAERARHRQAGVVHQVEDVVLVLHQPAHAVEGLLVLQSPVEQRPPELVPAVGPHVRERVQLGEHVALAFGLLGLDADAQRRGTTRPLEVEGFDGRREQTQLVLQRPDDRLAPGTRDVEMRRPSPPVRDREDVVRCQQAERRQGHGDAQDGARDDVGRVVLGQVEAGQRGDREDAADHPLADGAVAGRRAPASTAC